MKKIAQIELSCSVQAVRLYETDLRKIEEILASKTGASVSVISADGTIEYESWTEVREQLGPIIRELKIQAIRAVPGISLDIFKMQFRKYDVHLTASTGFELQFHQIEGLLRPRRRPIGVILYQSQRNLLVLAKPHEHATFWRRHEDNLVRGLIAIIGAIVGALLTYYLKR
jgi:hypothetical protein